MSLVARLIDSISSVDSDLWREQVRKALNTLLTVEDWHEIGSVGEPAFQNSWVNYSSNFAVAAFYKDPYGVIHIKGFVRTPGTFATTIFTLPKEYRPTANLYAAQVSASNFGAIQISANGQVIARTGVNTWLTLNASFRI